MKKLAVALSALCATSVLALAESDYSKDMKQVAPPPECDFNWTGFYVGGHFGYGWSTGDTSFEPLPSRALFGLLDSQSLKPGADGIFGGGQLGYNYQWNKLVLGVETDFSGSDFNGTKHRSPIPANNGITFPGTLTAHEDTDWFGTFRGRFGFAPMCKLLLYGTGGLAYGHTNYFSNTDFSTNALTSYPASADETSLGWTVGGGLEYAIAKRWTVKAEYLYIDLGGKSYIGNPVPANPPFRVRYDSQVQEHTVNVGLNYKF
jgi:outer membrane immunogenic protein